MAKKSFTDFIGDIMGIFIIGLLLIFGMGLLGVALIIIYVVYRFELLKKIFNLFKTNKKRKGTQGRKKKAFLPPKIKTKADEKYKKLLSKFKREKKRTPKRDEKFKLVVTASHHVYPVKGRNSRKWMRGEKGHWKRQKVRKYLLRKYKINMNFKMMPPKKRK